MFGNEITNTNFRAGHRNPDVGIGRSSSVGIVEPDQNGKRVTDLDVMRGRKRWELRPALGDDRDKVVERDVLRTPSLFGAQHGEFPSASTVRLIREGNPKKRPGRAQ